MGFFFFDRPRRACTREENYTQALVSQMNAHIVATQCLFSRGDVKLGLYSTDMQVRGDPGPRISISLRQLAWDSIQRDSVRHYLQGDVFDC